MFIIPLDNRREWYRYHHLFQELLQQRLSVQMSPEEVNDLHCRASGCMRSMGCSMKPYTTPWRPATWTWRRVR